MAHYKEEEQNRPIRRFFHRLFLSYIPNRRDNIKQILLKVAFLAALTTLIISAGCLIHYFLSVSRQQAVLDESRRIWRTPTAEQQETVSPIDLLLAENSDFKGWITAANANVDHPIYQTTDNSYYLTHNQKKQKNAAGALFFDYTNTLTGESCDKNLIIYGHNMKNGSMFGSLKKYRSLDFYKQNPTLTLSTLERTDTYKIFSLFVLNASRADDNGAIFNISRKSFMGEEDFLAWTAEAYERSLLYTGVDTQYGDSILTLVTCAGDFDNARLVIMARRTREEESPAVDTAGARANANPRYPARWYAERGIPNPWEESQE